MSTNTGRYKSTKKTDATIQESGWLNCFYTPLSDFTNIQDPVLSNTPVIGEINTIGTSHVWATGKGALSFWVKQEALDTPGKAVGAKGSKRMKWSVILVMKGDGPVIKEVVENMLNDQGIIHMQNGCESPQYVQFGCDCSAAEVDDMEFTSGTLEDGEVAYKLTFVTYKKLFYNGSITLRA